MVLFCTQNGNLLDLTYENDDIFNSVVVLNGGDVDKKCRVLAVRFQQHIFNILASGRALLAKYMEYSIIEGVRTKF